MLCSNSDDFKKKIQNEQSLSKKDKENLLYVDGVKSIIGTILFDCIRFMKQHEKCKNVLKILDKHKKNGAITRQEYSELTKIADDALLFLKCLVMDRPDAQELCRRVDKKLSMR